MKILFLIVVLLLIALPCAAEESGKAETVEIPLDQIWALDMPGTRDIHEIVKVDTTRVPPRPSQLDLIIRALLHKTSVRFPGYAVPGRPHHGLRWATRAIRGREPFGPIPSTEDTQLLFFSHVSSYRVELLSVRRDGFDIKIEYRFAPQYTSEALVSFALIPFGKLPAGKYHVAIQQAPMEQKHLDAGFEPVEEEQASHMVCGPFSFDVYEPPVPDPGPNKNAVLISLDQIWAYGMPGTREIHELDPKRINVLIGPIRRSLRPEWQVKSGKPQRPVAGAGFAVLGTGRIALEHAHEVLADKRPPRQSFPAGSDISVVFFSYEAGTYVHLHKVGRQGNTVEVRYRFVPHGTRNATEHFALIPLGKLSAGKLRVEIIQSPLQQTLVDRYQVKPLRPEWGRRIVCKSFSFLVMDPEND